VSDEPSENRWEQRLSPLIVKGGVLPSPSVLLRHAGELDLTPQELVLCLYILDKKWGPEWPYVSMLQAADELGRHKNKVYDWKKSLIQKGYLVATARTVPGIGRRADYCDLSGLFAALERLVLAEALKQTRGDLPTPAYDVSKLAPVSKRAPGSTGRSTLAGAPRSTENDAAGYTENGAARCSAGGATRSTRSGARTKVRAQEATPEEITHPEAAQQRAFRMSGAAPSAISVGAARPTEEGTEEGPGSHELAARIDHYGADFRDDDPARSRVRAHHAWWNSGLPRARFLALIDLARDKTREQISKSGVRNGPAGQRRAMPYFFAVLEDLARDETDRLRGAS